MMSEVNRTISERATHSFQKWKKHDSNLDFCDIENEEDENLIFVDLLKVRSPILLHSLGDSLIELSSYR